ncbi:RHS repeat-associated core domain-containing protein [Burkholderia orbicola]|uniref:RHS repeat-associated core domain-containing protein n=1 Tax=Burkholderia orbicola TaxID=2978683 RepID=UPI002FE220EC
MTNTLAFGTPTLGVLSNRGAPVRTLTYNRSAVDDPLDERIERTAYDARGLLASRIDTRLADAAGAPNFSYLASLSGHVLRTVGVDAGAILALADIDGRPLWSRDARGTVTTIAYDTLGRALAVTETAEDATSAVRETMAYGEATPDAQAHNLRGQCVRHYDTAGRLAWDGFTLTGQPLAETRTLLADPDAEPDWRGDDASVWDAQLDPTPYTTTWRHDAAGAWFAQTDAKGNLQSHTFDVAGRLAGSTLTLAGGSPQPVLSAIDYSAAGQVLSETAGNGVISTYAYEPQTQRLVQLTVTRPVQAARTTVLQDLHYTYDPVGNVLGLRDAAQATTYWRNQRVDSTRSYTYDALYQLISASGRESANRGQQGHTLPAPVVPTDASTSTNYTRTYAYDRGGNLTRIQHQGATAYTQDIVVSATSNHALQQNAAGSLRPAAIDDGTWFDPAGNQQMLLPDRTQPLAWNARNRLSRVTLVARPGAQDDRETYQYGGNGMRVRKCTATQTAGTTRTAEAITLPGLTLRITRSGDGQSVKVVQTLQDVQTQAGRTAARALHWETGQPDGAPNDALRYSHGNLIGSVGLELDAQAELISREEYYPYGGTAVWSARSQVEADTKFIRYSGKERDATGLYDYGRRSYQPWLGRWLNPDPAGTVDGLNLYRMVRNNPVSLRDPDGKAPQQVLDAYNRMVSKGEAWQDIRSKNGKEAIKKLSESNLTSLTKESLSGIEREFLSNFERQPFYLTHFTSSDIRNQNGSLEILSRVQLKKKGIKFSESNTDQLDLGSFATDDFAFFSIESGHAAHKSSSRFGNIRYRTPLNKIDSKVSKYAHLEATDLAQNDQRPVTKPPGFLSRDDKEKFFHGEVEQHQITDLIFYGKKMMTGIGLRIVRDLKEFSPPTRSEVLSSETPEQFNEIVNSFYRPQILFPHSIQLPPNIVDYHEEGNQKIKVAPHYYV